MVVTTLGTFDRPADFFDFNLKFLCLVGMWPYEHWPYTWKCYYKVYQMIILILSVIYLAITEVGMYQNRHDVVKLLNNIDGAIISYNFLSKILVFFIKCDRIKVLIMEILYSGDMVTEKCRKLMVKLVVIVTSLITSITGLFQLVAQAKGEVFVDAWLPFDPIRNKWTEFLAGLIIVVLFAVPVIYRGLAMQGIVCSIVMYLCDQLEDLQKRLKALNYSEENENCFRQDFKAIIEKHIRLMGYSKTLKSVFEEYFLIQNIAITAELCLSALMASRVGADQKKEFMSLLSLLMIALFNAYIFCYLGQELIDQSAGVAHAAYDSNWTSWPVDLQKDLLFVVTAAQRNFTLSAGGLTVLSMENYAQALYNGYSIYAVLRDVLK